MSFDLVTVACPVCARPAAVVEVHQVPFGGYGFRCGNRACAVYGRVVVYHSECADG